MSSPPDKDTSHFSAGNNHYGSHSPAGPPYSPITPEHTFATLNGPSRESLPPETIERPLPVPISESDNADAIALRSAISVLQLQRLQSLRDLKRLEEQKSVAVANSDQFAREVGAGRIKTASSGSALIAPAGMQQQSPSLGHDCVGKDTDHVPPRPISAFGDIPGPQNVVRCPPINWAKYHVAGQALDRLHERQTRNPDSELEAAVKPLGVPETSVLAPHNPWLDTASNSQMQR